ncbi:hypothetical protein PG984_015717 [Apiospora sp. TS-2023a]
MNGSINPSHKRVRATPPHLQPASGQSGRLPWGSASGPIAANPSQSGLNQKHHNGTSQQDRRTPQPQQSLNIMFESDASITNSRSGPDGTTPTSGKVFLYTHPTVDGCVIWELQRDNKFVTRDDVRAFLPIFGVGSNKILRRRADENQPIATDTLLFPNMHAAEELKRLIEENQKRMDHVNAPRFEEQNFKASNVGGVDVQALRELHPTPKSTQKAGQPSTKDNSQGDAQVVPNATNTAQNHKNGDVQKDNTIPPHKRTAKNTLPAQNPEANERKSPISSRPMQNGTSSSQQQEDSASSLIDMTSPVNGNARARGAQASPMPTKLIKIEADDKSKRPASEDLRDITYEATSSSARAESANKQPSMEATRGLFQQSSRSNLSVAKPIDSTDVKTPMQNTLKQQPESRLGHISGQQSVPATPITEDTPTAPQDPEGWTISPAKGHRGTEYLDNHFGDKNAAARDAFDHIDDHDTEAEINTLGNNIPVEPEQNTEPVLAPVPKTARIQLHDVERMLPVRNLSSASEKLMMGMTKGKYHGLIMLAKGLCEACVEMDVFPDRRLENATLMASLQALHQSAMFRSFNDDDKLNTVAFIYEKVLRGVTDSRITYTIDQMLDLNDERQGSPSSDVHDFNAMVEENRYTAPRVTAPNAPPYERQNIVRVAENSTQFLNPPTPIDDQAVTLPSPLNLPDAHNNPGRLTPPRITPSRESSSKWLDHRLWCLMTNLPSPRL